MSSGIPSDSQFKPVEPQEDFNPLAANGGKPLASGRPYLSDSTKKQLQAVGWTDGDPLPPDFAQKLTELRSQMLAEARQEIADLPQKMAGYVPPVATAPVDITTLPKEKQDEIRQWLSSFKEDVQLVEEVKSSPQLPPQQAQPQVQDQIPVQDIPEPTPPRAPHICQRCRWPEDVPFDLVVSDEDKRQFVIAILGGTRFSKQYNLLGGSLQLRLRSLTLQEVAMLNQQLGYMVRGGVINDNLEYLNYNMLFRTAMGTVQLAAGKDVKYTATSVETWTPPDDGTPTEDPTPLQKYLKMFTDSLPSESLMKIVSKTYREFQRLVELLEEMTNDTDFWKGINS